MSCQFDLHDGASSGTMQWIARWLPIWAPTPRSDIRQPRKSGAKEGADDRPHYGPDTGSERVGKDVRRAGVARRKIGLKDFHGEAHQGAQDDRGQSSPPELVCRQEGEKTETEGNEPDDVLQGGVPITAGKAEFSPERLEEDLLQDHVLARNLQVHA